MAADRVKMVYERRCRVSETSPRQALILHLERCISSSEPFSALTLAGNSNQLFESRVGDDELNLIVQTMMEAEAMLDVIDLRFNNISDRGANVLAKLFLKSSAYSCPIKVLQLAGNSIGIKGCEVLCSALRHSTSIEVLSLNGNPLGNEGGMAVAEMLYVNSSLLELDVGNTEIGTESIIALATVLNGKQNLLSLNIENPRLFSRQEESTYHLAAMLQVNRSLRHLNVAKHGMGDYGAATLAQHLLENPTLRALDLRCNRICVEGGEALAALLMRGSRLESLNLGANRVKDDGARAFAAALRSQGLYLRHLDLSSNTIGDEGLQALAQSISSPAAGDSLPLSDLALWGNDFGELSSSAFHGLFEGRFKYYQWRTDFRTYIVDGTVHVAQA